MIVNSLIIIEVTIIVVAVCMHARRRQAGQVAPPLARLGPSVVELKYPKAPGSNSGSSGGSSNYSPDPGPQISDLLYKVHDACMALIGGPSRDFSRPQQRASLQAARSLLLQKLDLRSWALFFLHTELSNDYDAYSSSVYLHVATAGGKLRAGPVWDKNLAFGNEHEVSGTVGWRFATGAVQNTGSLHLSVGGPAYYYLPAACTKLRRPVLLQHPIIVSSRTHYGPYGLSVVTYPPVITSSGSCRRLRRPCCPPFCPTAAALTMTMSCCQASWRSGTKRWFWRCPSSRWK